MSKNLVNYENKAESNFSLKIYSVYDTVLNEFHVPFVCRSSELNDICIELANNVSSKYYYNTSNYEVYYLGEFNENTGSIVCDVKILMSRLDSFIDDAKRKIQIAIQTLNYLPNGYFKMPDEMKKGIQEKIDNAIKDYCEEFIENNLNVVEQYSMNKAGV